MKFKIGDVVAFNCEEKHKRFPEYYPDVGTVGSVVALSDCDLLVRWEEGATSKDDEWYVDKQYVLLIREKSIETEIEKWLRDAVEIESWDNGECIEHNVNWREAAEYVKKKLVEEGYVDENN